MLSHALSQLRGLGDALPSAQNTLPFLSLELLPHPSGLCSAVSFQDLAAHLRQKLPCWALHSAASSQGTKWLHVCLAPGSDCLCWAACPDSSPGPKLLVLGLGTSQKTTVPDTKDHSIQIQLRLYLLRESYLAPVPLAADVLSFPKSP